MPNSKALLLSATVLLLASCSRHKPVTQEELRSQLASAASFAAETEILIDYVRQHRVTREYARGHIEYVVQAIDRDSKELNEALPGEVSPRALQECKSQLNSLADAVAAAGFSLNNPEALAAAKQRIVTIRKALAKANSSL